MEIATLAHLYEEADAPCRYQRVSKALESAIRQGLCLPGEALPTQRALAEALGLTIGTVTHGYAEAAKAGLIHAVVGRGTFVASNRPDVDVLPPPSLLDGAIPEHAMLPGRHAGLSASSVCWNLGFIAPFESLNPSLPEALAALTSRLDSRLLTELQSYHRPAGMDRHREIGASWRGVMVFPSRLVTC